MTDSIGLHNDGLRIVAAVILAALGSWTTRRFYHVVRPVLPRAIASVIASGIFAFLFTVWVWPDGPCGDVVVGVPLAVYREHTACVDILVSTPYNVPLALVDAFIAVGLGHGLGLTVFRLGRMASSVRQASASRP